MKFPIRCQTTLTLLFTHERDASSSKNRENLTRTFFGAGAFICFTILLELAFPGSFLESIWRLKPEAHVQFMEVGRTASIVLMAVIGVACGLSAIGLARNRQWGRLLAIAILGINLVGDSLNAWIRGDPRSLIGLPIGALMIWYLSTRWH